MPRVSIGIPVYNGERYLRDALASLAAQTLEDFEVVIGDNASSDGTESIAREFADTDRRFRYVRHERNLGAVPNYNRTFELARGEFFRWAAHDDRLPPDALERSVAALDADERIVLCHSRVRVIDERGDTTGMLDTGLSGAGSERASERFRALILVPHLCTEVFGLIRADVLRRTSLHLPYHGYDRALLAELGLLGRFHHEDEPVFEYRRHPEQYVRSVRAEDRAAWAESSARHRVGVPTWTLYRQYGRAVERFVEDDVERARCRRILRGWWVRNWHAARIGIEVISGAHPGIHRLAARVHRRLFPPESPAQARRP